MLKFSPLHVIPLLRNLLFHVAYVSEFDVTCMASSFQGRPEKLGGPGKRVKEGPQGQGGFHPESQLQLNCKSKT